jgi:hypothetical protein
MDADPVPLAGMGRLCGGGLVSDLWVARAVLDIRRRGFPVRTDNEPYAAKVSILEHAQQDAVAPLASGPRNKPVRPPRCTRRRLHPQPCLAQSTRTPEPKSGGLTMPR